MTADLVDKSRGRFTRGVWAVVLFTAAYLLVAAPFALWMGNNEFLLYIVVMVLLGCMLGFVHRRIGLPLPAVWCLSAWGLAHVAGGLVPVPESWPLAGEFHVLYSVWLVTGHLKYDQLVHAYGFGVTAYVCWVALRAMTGVRDPTAGMMVLAAAAAMGFGALNEVVEFVVTLLVPETNVGGYVNTGWDLVANAVGATAAVLGVRLNSATRNGRRSAVDAQAHSAAPPRS